MKKMAFVIDKMVKVCYNINVMNTNTNISQAFAFNGEHEALNALHAFAITLCDGITEFETETIFSQLLELERVCGGNHKTLIDGLRDTFRIEKHALADTNELIKSYDMMEGIDMESLILHRIGKVVIATYEIDA